MSEKFLRKLIGKTEIEDALKRLDKLTNEEVRMVTAQVLKATHTVDDRVVRIDDRVARVDEGVARIDGRVASIDDRVVHVDERVAGVEGRSFFVDISVQTYIMHPYREPITSGPSQVALSARSVY